MAASRLPRTQKTLAVRFPGIFRHARKLGVERSHLYRVLCGQRASASLLRRYRELLAREEAAR